MDKKDIINRQNIDPKLLERAKEFRREMTDAEAKLWGRLRGNKLDGHHFRRQQIIGNYIVDFYCHKSSLVVEVDGGVHNEQKQHDQERDEFLRSSGLNVLRFTNIEVEKDLTSVLTILLEACKKMEE